MIVDRQTHRHTQRHTYRQTRSSQYSALPFRGRSNYWNWHARVCRTLTWAAYRTSSTTTPCTWRRANSYSTMWRTATESRDATRYSRSSVVVHTISIQVAAILVASAASLCATLRIRLRISAGGKFGHAQVWLPLKKLPLSSEGIRPHHKQHFDQFIRFRRADASDWQTHTHWQTTLHV